MKRKQWLSKSILLCLLLSIATPAIAAMDASFLEMSEQMDGIDKQDFQAAIDKANGCTRARNFPCAEAELAKAAKAANSGQDKKTLQAGRNSLANERQQLALEIRRAEEERLAQIRRDEEEKYAQRKRDEEREAREWRENREAQEAEDRQSTRDYNASIGAQIMQNINNNAAMLANIDRQTSAAINESNRVRAAQAAERDRARAEKAEQEADRRRAAERDRTTRADAQRTADNQRAQEDKRIRQQEQERRQKQARLEEQAQAQEQARQREQERKQEQARKKAEAERAKLAEKQAEEQARAQYLKSVTAGTRLVATKCPDGEGKYYATGTRPNIKPELVGCVDVRFRAYCAGDSLHFTEGTAHNFIGMGPSCFGDTYDISPKPPCKVDQVRIEVIEARGCSN